VGDRRPLLGDFRLFGAVPLLGERRLFGGNEQRFGRLIPPPLAGLGWPSRSSYNDNRTSPVSNFITLF
jgi:hypothetical protein